MVLTSVVLPAPFAPSTAVMLPSGTESDTRSSAMTPPYATVRSVISSMCDLLRGRTSREHLSEVEHRDGVAHRHHHVDVVLDKRNRGPLAKDAKQVDELVHVGCGKAACRLIEEQQRRVCHQRASDDHALLNAMRQHAWIRARAV